MSYIDKVNQVLASRGYDPNARLADYRDPNGNKSYVAKPVNGNFLGNVGKSLGSIPGAVVNGIADSLGNTSFAKMPQIAQSIGRTGFSLGPINIKGSVNKRLEQRDTLMAQAQKDFKAGKIDGKEYAKRLNKAIADTNVTQDINKSKGALKDASRYGTQYVNTALALGAVVGGVAGAAGKTGLNAIGTTAVDQAYSGGIKAFGKGILGEAGALARPFSGQASGGVLKGVTGALGGALDAQAMASTVNEARKGKIDPLNAALTATSLAPGGIVKLGSEGIGKAGKAINKAIYDTHGLYDVVKLKGGTSVNEAFTAAQKLSKNAKKDEKILKVFQDLAVQEHGKGPEAVARAIEANQPDGKKFADMTYNDFIKAASSIVSDRTKLQAVAKNAGLKIPEGAAVVAARLTPESKAAISKRLSQADDPIKEFTKLKREGLIKGPNLPGQIEDMVKSGVTGEQLAKKVNSLKAVPAALVDGAPVVTKDGRFLAFAKGAGTVKKASEVGDIVKGQKAKLGAIGRTLEKMGLSTKQADPAEQRAIFNKVKDNFVKTINADEAIKTDGKTILSTLNKLTDTKPGVFDIRQLRSSEIASSLGVSKSEANTIMAAYNDAFKSLGYAERGLAGKITDFNMRNNPIAAPYSRIQSVARYEKNPSFRLQENIETGIGSKLLGGKAINPMTDKYNKSVKILEDNGFFKREFAGPAGEGSAGLGAISAKLSPFQKKKFAADINFFAGGDNKMVDFISDPKNASLLQDIKSIAQYPDKGFTSSNMMKALNLAVFPLRYNLKVTSVAAKALGKQSGVRQMAILKGLSDFNRWQKTPDGVKWNSKNSEVLGVLRYFTPVGSVESVLNMLDPRNVKNVRDLGTIGGLPFGVVSQVLQGQGLINTDSPYLDPKTGEVVPNKLPQDLKARTNQALVDILGTMFTFPGRQVGLDSKRKISQTVVDNATFGLLKGGKTESVTRTDLTAEQKYRQKVLQAGQGSTVPKSPSVMKNRNVDISSKKPVTITPIYKLGKPKRAKAKATPPGQFRP